MTSYLSCERDSHVIALAVLQHRIGVSVRAKCGTVGFACKVFQRIGAECVSVEMFSQTCSERSICIIVPESARTKVAKALKEYTVEVSENLCILAVVGESMRNTPGVAADVCALPYRHAESIFDAFRRVLRKCPCLLLYHSAICEKLWRRFTILLYDEKKIC